MAKQGNIEIYQKAIPAVELPLLTHRLFLSVAGTKPTPFQRPQHVYVWTLEASNEEPIASNDGAPLVLSDGADNIGLYTAIREALPHIPKDSVLALIAPQEELAWVFSEGLASLKQRNFRRRNHQPYTHRDHIFEVYQLATDKGIELLSQKPIESFEVEKCYVARDEARARLRHALEQQSND
ncbi:hypothetical protein [Rhizobium sp. BT-175]|uniref:hypothetical protein n=1 Tax=Rhizobium sp. BT-175 TaxID=2986929 RepID=UPI00223556D1|nr:hypothetical protein [Rhizobium sp. BT-175]MCV9944913.1 hypothetical protein [Rhizobium sp. BT-175]